MGIIHKIINHGGLGLAHDLVTNSDSHIYNIKQMSLPESLSTI